MKKIILLFLIIFMVTSFSSCLYVGHYYRPNEIEEMKQNIISETKKDITNTKRKLFYKGFVYGIEEGYKQGFKAGKKQRCSMSDI